jgi:hypothetical protein
LRISNCNRLPAAETSILAVFHRKSILSALLALIFLSFFGTLTLCASMFPKSYDWRYSVISHLLSPRDNPSHYRLAAGGLALTGLLMLPFAGYLRRQLGMIAPRVALVCAGSFLAAIVALICACFIAPQHAHDLLRIRRLHELLGRSAAGFLALAMICGCWCALKGRHKSRGAMLVVDLVCPHPVATGGHFLQRGFVAPDAAGTNSDAACPRCAKAFRLLAPRFLGMDRRCSRLRLSLCRSFPDAAASQR